MLVLKVNLGQDRGEIEQEK